MSNIIQHIALLIGGNEFDGICKEIKSQPIPETIRIPVKEVKDGLITFAQLQFTKRKSVEFKPKPDLTVFMHIYGFASDSDDEVFWALASVYAYTAHRVRSNRNELELDPNSFNFFE